MSTSLCHHGVKGQKWGIRRYQNRDGTWTDAGKKRYGDSDGDPSGSSVKASSATKKKVAIGVATGAAIVAGTVLTAYLVKKYGVRTSPTLEIQLLPERTSCRIFSRPHLYPLHL